MEDYQSEILTVWTKHSEVRTEKTEGQYSENDFYRDKRKRTGLTEDQLPQLGVSVGKKSIKLFYKKCARGFSNIERVRLGSFGTIPS